MMKPLRVLVLRSFAMLLAVASSFAGAQAQAAKIEAFTIHPPVAARFMCAEHPLGAENHVPDALAADCLVVKRNGGPNGNLTSFYSGNGTRNEDWHGWREPLLAPCDGIVTIVSLNPQSATPGTFGQGRSSAMLFRCGAAEDRDAVQVAYVHIREVTVKEGDTVKAGQAVARIGNNGNSYNPHVHIGAFRGQLFSNDALPLQIRIDLAALGRIARRP
jgi:peptidase M23-like protein